MPLSANVKAPSNFEGRSAELAKLSDFFEKRGLGVALIYGRRRIGKSALLKQAVSLESGKSGSSCIYYECRQTTAESNTDGISALASDVLELPPLGFSGLEPLLDFMFQRSRKQRLVLVLDEYPYLKSASHGLDSVLQALIDRYRDDPDCQMKLILCGSYIDIMRSLTTEESPLYGRVDLTIELKAMDYYDSALFYPGFSDEDKVRLYSVFGGVPHYNRLVDPEKNVRDNVTILLSEPGSRLENEIPMYLSSEIAKIVNANEVFDALARGFSKYSDILAQSHVSSGPALADVLDRLIRMGLVKKEAPINDEKNKRKAGYFIDDSMANFYYRYIFRYASQRSIMEKNAFYDRYISEDFETQYVPKVFENICRQYLIRKNRAGELAEPFTKIGKYYYDDPKAHKNGEFDLVTEDANGYIFYEVKFRKAPLSRDMVTEEMAQVAASGLHCYRYGFFSRSGFERGLPKDIIRIPLSELYAGI